MNSVLYASPSQTYHVWQLQDAPVYAATENLALLNLAANSTQPNLPQIQKFTMKPGSTNIFETTVPKREVNTMIRDGGAKVEFGKNVPLSQQREVL